MAGRRLCLSTAMQRPSSRIAHFTHRPGVTCPTEIFARITPSSVDKRRLSVHRNLSTEGWQDTYKDAFYITTNPYFNDRKTIREVGFVVTSHVRTVNIISDVWSALSGVVGGETFSYTKLLNEASETAMEKLAREAVELGANAITGVTFRHSTTMNRLIIGLHASVVVYGNAVVVEDNPLPATSR
eukprot:gb/GECG01006260.1/.p1 GENE.gb/GECG01006260.1/~~gb/GECG01006260.1/.p1  ORF type:complete len:185 (+),score=12.24 gb/GECG01006260.1/:1-555(+)